MTMQRKVHCDNPNCPWERLLRFNDWIRAELPSSHFGFYVTDIDFVLYNEITKKVTLLETKTRNKDLTFTQKKIFPDIRRWIKKGIDADWQFLGFHIIRFERSFFNDGKVYLDDKETTERELKNTLSKV